jgi:hypothetical protein
MPSDCGHTHALPVCISKCWQGTDAQLVLEMRRAVVAVQIAAGCSQHTCCLKAKLGCCSWLLAPSWALLQHSYLAPLTSVLHARARVAVQLPWQVPVAMLCVAVAARHRSGQKQTLLFV